MAKIITINVSAVFAFVVVGSLLVSHPALAAGLSCKTVVSSLVPCEGYLTKGGAVPSSCCKGIRALNSQANTRPARQTACNCLKLAAKAYKVSQRYAAALPSVCKVNVGTAISFTTNCRTVK